MTVQHMAMVLAAGGMKANEKILLLAYCNHTDAHGYCWPGIPRLVDETGMSEATVKRANAALRARKLIKSMHRTNPRTGEQITNLTRVNLALLESMRRPERDYGDNLVDQITFDEGEESSQVTPGAQNEPPPGLKMSPPPAQNEPPRGVKVSPKTSPKPSVETSSSCAVRSVTEDAGVSREEEVRRPEAKDGGTDSPPVGELVDRAVSQWSEHRAPDARERLTLAERAAEALTQGATPEGVVYALTRDLEPSRTRSAVAVVMARTRLPGWANQTPPATPKRSVSSTSAAEANAVALAHELACEEHGTPVGVACALCRAAQTREAAAG